MLRYCYIGDQICEYNRDFAFFDTIPDRFVDIDGEHIFSSRTDFIEVAVNHPQFERMKGLIPVSGARSPYIYDSEREEHCP